MNNNTNPGPSSLKKWAPAMVIGAGFLLGGVFFLPYLQFEVLRENRDALMAWRDSNYFVAALTYIFVYILVVAFSLPGGLVMTLTGGFLFGIIAGSFLSVLAATVGATTIFLAAKSSLGDTLSQKLLSGSGADGRMAKMRKGLQDNEVSYLLLMRLIPAIPFFIANLAPAFLGVKLRNYVLTTFFGIMPASLVYSSVGAGLGDVFARGETPNLGIIFEWHILGPILGLCALALLPIVLKKFSKKEA